MIKILMAYHNTYGQLVHKFAIAGYSHEGRPVPVMHVSGPGKEGLAINHRKVIWYP